MLKIKLNTAKRNFIATVLYLSYNTARTIKGLIDVQTEKILSAAGLRTTKQRKKILELLIENASPLTHAEILSMLEEPLDRVTLYRTLQTLQSSNIVHQVQGLDGAWRFCAHDMENEGCPGGHPHFLCLQCGKMFCLSDQKIPRVEVPEGMTVEGKQLVIYGSCSECAPQKD